MKHYLIGNKGAHMYNGNMASSAGKMFECRYCQKQYKSAVTLKNHKCSYCEHCKKLYSTFQKKKLHTCSSQQPSLDVQLTSMQDHCAFRFRPVTEIWQRKQASNIGINRIVLCQRQHHDKPIGKPGNITPINGDGNCFFRCISYLITGSEENHMLFRTLLVRHMESHPNIMSIILPNQTVTQYLMTSKMTLNRTWATEVEIYAMAHFLKTDIYVYTFIENTNTYKWLCHSGHFIDTSMIIHNPSVYLNHKNGNHYEIINDVISDNISPQILQGSDLLAQELQRQKIREKEKQRQQVKRSCPEYKYEEKRRRKQTTESRLKQSENKREKRKLDSCREVENKKKREDSKSRQKEREIKQEKRQCQNYREKENQKKRESSKSRQKEQQIKNDNRKCKTFAEKENQRKRESSKSRYKEQEIKHEKRKSQTYRETENVRKRQSLSNRYKEKEHKQIVRCDSQIKEKEKMKKKEKRDASKENIVDFFHQLVQNGPTYVCVCCDQTWYRESVQLATKLRANKDLSHLFPVSMSENNKEWICHTCCTYVNKNKIPPLSKVYIKFPEKSPCLFLTNLEERLIAPRIPFMMLHELPRGGQISLSGNVVNVPANVNNTVTHLPRLYDDNSCIPLKLKRQLSKHNHVSFENIRPNLVHQALQYLVDNSELYKEEGITVNRDWKLTHSKTLPDQIDESNSVCNDQTCPDMDEQSQSQDSEWDESTPEDQPAGSLDTMMQPQNLMSDDKDVVFSFAPAEGNFPVSVFTDKYSEELSFPTIFCGEKRNCPPKLSYNDICKAELRHVDKRVAGHIPNIFFKLKKLQAKHILEKSNIMIRKTKGQLNRKAGDLKSEEQLKELCNVDEGYKVLKQLRGSPPYWESTKKDLFAMLRVLGIPTWFMSFSSAETRWVHLLNILSQSVNKKQLSTEEINQLSFLQKSELIRKDPVTCARHFHHQVKQLLNNVLRSSRSPVGEICDFFYKVEFQMRGSPHIHMIVWVKDAPKLDESLENEEAVLQFVDAHSTCVRDESLGDLISLQEHNHSRTCKKKNENICRFHYPIPPMRQTCILEPLDSTVPEEEKLRLEELWKKISKSLNIFKKETTEIMTYDEYLQFLEISEDDYLNAVRSSITSKKLFLKRGVHETRINPYNQTVLSCWRANMDIQFVIDAYACAVYVVSYIAKAQRGMSNLLYHAVEEARQGNTDITKQVRSIGHKFLNHVEISAQEAVFYILQLPLKQSSRDVIFINTSPPEERVAMLKSHTVLKNLPDDSLDIQAKSIIDRYTERPTCLEDICLADFCSSYKLVYKNAARYSDNGNDDDDIELDDETSIKTQENTVQRYRLFDGNFIVRRQKSVIVRYVRYQQMLDQENYFREILMLFVAWRDEQSLIGDSETFTQQFHILNKDESVTHKMDQYHHTFPDLDKAIQDASDMQLHQLATGWNDVASHTRAEEAQDEDVELLDSEQFHSLAPTSTTIQSFSDFSTSSVTTKCEILKNCLPEDEYLKMVRSLNSEQMLFFLHLLNEIKLHDKPVYYFLSGGAGVGKTVLVKVIFQALLRWFNSSPSSDPDKAKVLLSAPTGKAAYLIKGNTLHSLLHIPANQGYSYKPLAADTLNSYRTKFSQVKLLIIDEISMVGNSMFSFINQRLRQIMGSTKLFGGISVLAVGDLYQLKPVFDNWIFEPLTHDYGPLATNIWKENFKLYELTTIMRQKDSKIFAELLNRLRKNKQTSHDIQVLKRQLINTDLQRPDYPLLQPHIYLTNSQVSFHNDFVCESQGQRTVSNKSIDVVLGDVTPAVKQKILSKIPENTSKTMGLSKEVKTALGLRHELSCNVDVEDGLANGASCILKSLGQLDKNGHYIYLWVQFENEEIGQHCRQKNKQLYIDRIDKTWTPIFRIKRQFPVGRYKCALVMRHQFPIRCAAAKTSHRCQGDTMQSAVIDLSGRSFPHAHYVALSRVTHLENLKIRDLNEKKIRVDRSVCQEMTRLQACELKLTDTFKINTPDEITVMYHNVRSLRKHFLDVKAMPYDPEILILSETKLGAKDTDEYILPGYQLIRYDCSLNTAYGLAVYVKDTVSLTLLTHEVQKTYSGVTELLIFDVTTPILNFQRIIVAAVYVSPKTKKEELNILLQSIETYLGHQHCPCVLLGDFNINLLFQKFSITSMEQCMEQPTTDYGSLLDHIYVNTLVSHYRCGTFECYFSDHKAIYISLQPQLLVINMDKYQLDWLCEHLGHTGDLHKAHYRQMSGMIERVKMTKLFMIQDMNLTQKFRDKKLDEIDITDIVFPNGDKDSLELEDFDDDTLVNTVVADLPQNERDEEPAEELVFEDEDSDDEEEMEEEIVEQDLARKKKAKPKFVRQRWDEIETEEIMKYFKSFLDAGITPRSKEVESAKRKSQKMGGKLWKRSNDKIIKKISAMNHKK